MKNALQILFIDDHPTIIEGYKSILKEKYTEDQLEVYVAYSSESGYEKLFQSNIEFIVFFDWILLRNIHKAPL